MTNIQRAAAYIDLGILEENYNTIRSKLSPEVGLLCVVKADAYGHGAIEVSRRFESLGAFYLGVATIDEALELRTNKIKIPILVMSGIMPWDDVSALLQQNLTPVVYDFDTLARLCDMKKDFQTPIKVHLKFDTGMGRLGFMPDGVSEVIGLVEGANNIKVDGLMSHFSSSEIRDDYGIAQVNAFRKVIEEFEKRGFQTKVIHMANSGAITNYPEAHFTMVRAGISLYGSHSTLELKKQLPTRPVLKFTSRIALIREFPAGHALSYGRTYVTSRKTKVAYIPVGYTDGYPRSLSNKGSVLINNNRCNIIGRICMDWFLVDITDLNKVNIKDEVILLGESKTDAVTAYEIGEISGTIPYEILCKISKRVTRVYI
jgi:alanine racemase